MVQERSKDFLFMRGEDSCLTGTSLAAIPLYGSLGAPHAVVSISVEYQRIISSLGLGPMCYSDRKL